MPYRWLGAIALAVLAAIASAPLVAQTMPIAETAEPGPLVLGAQPLTVKLQTVQGSLDDRLRATRNNDRLYLVIEGIRAKAAVEGVYELYLDLPAGATPSRADPHYVGDVNFFDASGRRGASFDITDLIDSLRRGGTLPYHPTVTLVLNGSLDAAARPSVARIAIISRPR